MTEENKEHPQCTNYKNIFLDQILFNDFQMDAIKTNILYGSYQTFQTQVMPTSSQEWNHLIYLPGTALKFCNKLNISTAAQNLLSLMNAKNIPFKVHALYHRFNPVHPEVWNDHKQMIQIILNQQKPKTISLMTWSAGCCYLKQTILFLKERNCQINKIILISPSVDMFPKQRKTGADFLNNDFFQFVQKQYCKGNIQHVKQLSLTYLIKEQKQNHFLVNQPITLIYGDSEYIVEDIIEYIELLNKQKKSAGKVPIQVKCFPKENHSMYCFVTTKQVSQNKQKSVQIARKKWFISKFIADTLQKMIEQKSNSKKINIQTLKTQILSQVKSKINKKVNSNTKTHEKNKQNII